MLRIQLDRCDTSEGAYYGDSAEDAASIVARLLAEQDIIFDYASHKLFTVLTAFLHHLRTKVGNEIIVSIIYKIVFICKSSHSILISLFKDSQRWKWLLKNLMRWIILLDFKKFRWTSKKKLSKSNNNALPSMVDNLVCVFNTRS